MPEERRELADPEQMYAWLGNMTKSDIDQYLGAPDKVDDFGDYVYLIGQSTAAGYTYDLTCTIAFDGTDKVKRIEVVQPQEKTKGRLEKPS